MTPQARGTTVVRAVVTSPDGKGTAEVTTSVGVLGVPRTVAIGSDIGDSRYSLVVGTATSLKFTFSDPADAIADALPGLVAAADGLSATLSYIATAAVHSFSLNFSGITREATAGAYLFPTLTSTALTPAVVTVGSSLSVAVTFGAWPEGTTATATATGSGGAVSCAVSRLGSVVTATFVPDSDTTWTVTPTLKVGNVMRDYTTTIGASSIYSAVSSVTASSGLWVAGSAQTVVLTLGGPDAPGSLVSVTMNGTVLSDCTLSGMVVTCLNVVSGRATTVPFAVTVASPDGAVQTTVSCTHGPVYEVPSSATASVTGGVIGLESTHDVVFLEAEPSRSCSLRRRRTSRSLRRAALLEASLSSAVRRRASRSRRARPRRRSRSRWSAPGRSSRAQ